MLKRLIRLGISLNFFAFHLLWAKISFLFGIKRLGGLIVLYYHAISDDKRLKFVRQLDSVPRFTSVANGNRLPLIPIVNYVALTFDDGFASVLRNAVPVLLERKIPFTVFVPSAYLGQIAKWTLDESWNEQVMDESELAYLSSMPTATIGSHCVSHTNLLHMDVEEVTREIIESKRHLEEILARPVRFLSFPYGEYTQECIQIARKAGYERVFTSDHSYAFLSPDEYVIGRVRVDPDDWNLEFRLKILGAYCWLPVAITIKRKFFKLCMRILSLCFLR